MPTPQPLNMVELSELVDPFSVRYWLDTPWGVTSQEFSFDILALAGNGDAKLRFAQLFWSSFVATATCRSTSCSVLETMIWKSQIVPTLSPVDTMRGLVFASGSAMDSTGIIVMHTGAIDKYGRRRWFLSGMPRIWHTDDRQLNNAGKSALMQRAFAGMIGMSGDIGSPVHWCLAFPGVIPGDGANPLGVAFRYVSHLRVCQYCDKAPDTIPVSWP